MGDRRWESRNLADQVQRVEMKQGRDHTLKLLQLSFYEVVSEGPERFDTSPRYIDHAEGVISRETAGVLRTSQETSGSTHR